MAIVVGRGDARLGCGILLVFGGICMGATPLVQGGQARAAAAGRERSIQGV